MGARQHQHQRPLPQIPELEAPRWGMPEVPQSPRRVRIATWLRRPRLDDELEAVLTALRGGS